MPATWSTRRTAVEASFGRCASTRSPLRSPTGTGAIVFNAVAETTLHAVQLYESLGFEVLATIPKGFLHPTAGYVGLHVMHLAL